VRREAANRVTIDCWYQRRCGAFGVHRGGRGGGRTSSDVAGRADLAKVTLLGVHQSRLGQHLVQNGCLA
jgi:hypothetical protein